MDFATMNSIWTVIVLVLFVGITAWAFSPSRKEYLERAGQSVLEGDDDTPGQDRSDDSNGGRTGQ